MQLPPRVLPSVSSLPHYHGPIIEPDCHLCPLQKDVKVYPDGPIPAKLCFVGEGPGDAEIRQGKGFIGPSGQLLWALAASVGISREQIWVTNACHCKKREVFFTSGASLTERQVTEMSTRACRRRLIGELLTVTRGDPAAVIIPLGNWALWSLSSRSNARIFAYRGAIMSIDLPKLWEEVCRGLQPSGSPPAQK